MRETRRGDKHRVNSTTTVNVSEAVYTFLELEIPGRCTELERVDIIMEQYVHDAGGAGNGKETDHVLLRNFTSNRRTGW